MSSLFAFGNVSGASAEATGFYNDGKCGRINFEITSISGSAVSVAVSESNLDGSGTVVIGAPVTLQPGGQVNIAINSVKPVVKIISGSGNTGEAFVRVDALYLGTFGRGTLGLKEKNDRTGFSGAEIPR
jgi:hypothetical protein